MKLTTKALIDGQGVEEQSKKQPMTIKDRLIAFFESNEVYNYVVLATPQHPTLTGRLKWCDYRTTCIVQPVEEPSEFNGNIGRQRESIFSTADVFSFTVVRLLKEETPAEEKKPDECPIDREKLQQLLQQYSAEELIVGSGADLLPDELETAAKPGSLMSPQLWHEVRCLLKFYVNSI